MSIDAGDRWAEYQIKEREEVGRYMYEHQEDYVSRSRYKKTVDQLTKAKEIIKKLKALYLYPVVTKDDVKRQDEILAEAEQFIKDSKE